MEQSEFSYTSSRYNDFEKHFTSFLKVSSFTHFMSSHSTSGYLPKRKESTWPNKQTDMNAHCGLVCVCAQLLQLCLTLCDPVDCSPPDSPAHGILQARLLECVATPSSREPARPSVFCVSCITGELFTRWATWEAPICTWIPAIKRINYW